MNENKYPDLEETLKNNPALAKAFGKDKNIEDAENVVKPIKDFNSEVLELLNKQISIQDSIYKNTQFFFWIIMISIFASIILALMNK